MLCTSTPESADAAAPFLRLPSRERDRERDRERERAVPLEPRGAVPEAVVVGIDGNVNTAVGVLVSGTVGKREKKKTATGVRVPGSPISAQELRRAVGSTAAPRHDHE